MFEKGDYIIYGSTGVRRVEAIGTPKGISSADPRRQYYTLIPVYGAGTIYIPVDSSVSMRPILSKEEAEELVRRIPEIREDACSNSDQRMLASQYQAFIRSHRCEDLIQLIKSIYCKSQTMQRNGKRTGMTDRQYMKKAEDLLHGELSISLGIPIEEVPAYIAEQIGGKRGSRPAETGK